MSVGLFTAASIRWVLFAVSVALVLAFPRQVPPDLSEATIRKAEGVYQCHTSPGKSPSARESIDHVPYASHFSFAFGYSSTGSCFDELSGRKVVVRYVDTHRSEIRLLLSLRDVESGVMWGADENERLDRLREYLAQPWWFRVWQGLAVLVLALVLFPREFQRSLVTVGRITRLSK